MLPIRLPFLVRMLIYAAATFVVLGAEASETMRTTTLAAGAIIL